MPIREVVSCNLCRSNIYKPLYVKRYFDGIYQVVKCESCGLVYMNPRFTEEKNKDFYDDKYYYFSEIENRISATEAINHFKILRNYADGGRLLDIGCARGFFLKAANQNGWQVRGVDISDYACEFAKEQFGLNVSLGNLEDIKFPEEHFDAITLWNVLEHLRDPRKTLKRVKKLLKNGGVLFIKIPNINSIYYRLYRRYWLGFNPFHLYYFSFKTIKEMLEQLGFEAVRLDTEIVDLLSKEGLWNRGLKTPLAEMLDTLGLKDKIEKRWVKKKFIKPEKANFRQIDLESLFLPRSKLINLINHPINRLINGFKMGDHLLVIAKKLD